MSGAAGIDLDTHGQVPCELKRGRGQQVGQEPPLQMGWAQIQMNLPVV
jgi:hypothetical protein